MLNTSHINKSISVTLLLLLKYEGLKLNTCSVRLPSHKFIGLFAIISTSFLIDISRDVIHIPLLIRWSPFSKCIDGDGASATLRNGAGLGVGNCP